MSAIEVQQLLEAVTEALPCGEDLSGDPLYEQMEKASRHTLPGEFAPEGTASTPPDWRRVAPAGLDLLSRTKDLRVAVHLTTAWFNLEGFAGLERGLALCRGLVENYWDSVHPQFDSESDLILRAVALEALADPEAVIAPAQHAVLIDAAEHGTYTLRDVDIAVGRVARPNEGPGAKVSKAEIEAALKASNAEALQAMRAVFARSLEHLTFIDSVFLSHVDAAKQQPPNTIALVDVLNRAAGSLGGNPEQLETATASPEGGPPGANGEGQSSASGDSTRQSESVTVSTGAIRSRGDVVRLLDQIDEFFERNEPSSPVPLLIRRARNLVSKNFVEIMQDVAPDALAQAQWLRGPDKEAAEKESAE